MSKLANMTTVAPPQQRPLVLLHKCGECATFAIAPSAITEKNTMDIDRIRLRFSQVLGLSHHNRSTPKKGMDERDDDSAYGSSVSGQSSPDESPVSRSDSPSPIDQKMGSIAIDNVVHASGRPQNPFRYRSMSESGENSTLKGILKRHGTVLRSLSQCEEEKLSYIPRNGSSESQSLDSSNEEVSDRNISESGEDEDSGRERSQSNSSTLLCKKTVRFDDRVQEKVFRPNSSILGQRKKNQRKQQRKRKRTSSGDSQTGESEHENDHESTETEDGECIQEPPQEITKVPEPTPAEKPSTNPKPISRKKVQRQGPVVLDDKRYNGFVLGTEKKPGLLNHRRHSSGDSGLGDDEEDGEVFTSAAPKIGNKNRRRRTVSCGDSGMDE